MDLVVNHTSDEHPWFVESRVVAGRRRARLVLVAPAARRAWPPGDPGAEPTNWRSFFSGPAWELDEASGEYYLHLFSRTQPDLNWEQPAVREAVYSMMRWWLDRGVDGFRMDVINMISKDPALPDGPVLGDGPLRRRQPRRSSCGPRIHEFLQEMHREVFADRDGRTITVGEMPGVTIDDGRLFTDPARGELDMVFQFEHVDLDHGAGKWDPRPLDLLRPQGVARAVAGRARRRRLEQPVLVQPRPAAHRVALGRRRRAPRALGDDAGDGPPPAPRDAVRVPGRGARHDERGVHVDRRVPRHRGPQPLPRRPSRAAHDPAAVLAAMAPMHRDNARTPMQWDDSPHAGFTTGTPWIAVNPNHATINAAAARADERSVFHHYRRLIELRHTSDVVVDGDFDDAARRPSRTCTRSPARSAPRRCSCSATSPATHQPIDGPRRLGRRRGRARQHRRRRDPFGAGLAPVGGRRAAAGGMIR